MDATTRIFYLSIPIGLGMLGTYWILYRPRRKLPPINSEGMVTTLLNLGGEDAPLFFESKRKELGPIYRLNTMDLAPWIVVCHPNLAKQLLNEHHEKNYSYKLMRGSSFGIDGLFSKNTFHDGWDWARKHVVNSFSFTNLNLKISSIHQHLQEIHSTLSKFADERTSFDLDIVGVDLTMNILISTMFSIDKNSYPVQNIGKKLQGLLHVMLKEYCSKQVYQPWRKYCFWDKEVQAAKQARQELYDILFDILRSYRSSHSEEEIQQDSSILGHLVRRYLHNLTLFLKVIFTDLALIQPIFTVSLT